MVKNNISDLLTRIRNASLARHNSTYASYSKLNLSLLYVLFENGYISGYKCKKKKTIKSKIQIFLKYKGWWVKKPKISIIKQISSPGKHIYVSYCEFEQKIADLKSGCGIAIISTSNGIMSHLKAKKYKKGGEVLFYIE